MNPISSRLFNLDSMIPPRWYCWGTGPDPDPDPNPDPDLGSKWLGNLPCWKQGLLDEGAGAGAKEEAEVKYLWNPWGNEVGMDWFLLLHPSLKLELELELGLGLEKGEAEDEFKVEAEEGCWWCW